MVVRGGIGNAVGGGEIQECCSWLKQQEGKFNPQIHIRSRSRINADKPAEIGMVRNQAISMSLRIIQRTLLMRSPAPAPTIAELTT